MASDDQSGSSLPGLAGAAAGGGAAYVGTRALIQDTHQSLLDKGLKAEAKAGGSALKNLNDGLHATVAEHAAQAATATETALPKAALSTRFGNGVSKMTGGLHRVIQDVIAAPGEMRADYAESRAAARQRTAARKATKLQNRELRLIADPEAERLVRAASAPAPTPVPAPTAATGPKIPLASIETPTAESAIQTVGEQYGKHSKPVLENIARTEKALGVELTEAERATAFAEHTAGRAAQAAKAKGVSSVVYNYHPGTLAEALGKTEAEMKGMLSKASSPVAIVAGVGGALVGGLALNAAFGRKKTHVERLQEQAAQQSGFGMASPG